MPSWNVTYTADCKFTVDIEAETLDEAQQKFDSGDWLWRTSTEVECIPQRAVDAEWEKVD